MRKFLSSIFEVIEVTAVALLAVFSIRTFLVQPFLVSGASMVPTFSNGDYLLVDELTYRFAEPDRGQVIVFRYPKDESTFFIKRIIGLPGEKVVIADGRVTVINAAHPEGFTLDEHYLPQGLTTSIRPGESSTYTLAATQYLVLGDNRPYSYDSRDWGLLDKKEIIGRVVVRLWPPAGLTVFAAPTYTQ